MERLRPRTNTQPLLLFFLLSTHDVPLGVSKHLFVGSDLGNVCYLIHQSSKVDPKQHCLVTGLRWFISRPKTLHWLERFLISNLSVQQTFLKKGFFKQKNRNEQLRCAKGKKKKTEDGFNKQIHSVVHLWQREACRCSQSYAGLLI